MVDVGAKPVTSRQAQAEAFLRLEPSTVEVLRKATLKKGDALATSQLAGIMAAKRTHELIPLAHPLPLAKVDVAVELQEGGVHITATAKVNGQTGVEMEALTAVSIAALTMYDMVKGIERGVEIERVRLLKKSGGRSGTWTRKR